MNTHRWLFNTFRRPVVPTDVPKKQRGNDYIAALRRGHLSKIDLTKDGRTVSFRDLHKTFQCILDEPLDDISWVSVLTTDERTSWSQVSISRPFTIAPNNVSQVLKQVATNNQEYLDVLKKSLFIVSLDEGSPTSSPSRTRAFVIDDNINRWNDKMLHIIVMSNGVSATYGEHSIMDGPTTNELNRRLETVIMSHNREIAPEGVMPGSTPLPLQYIPFCSTRDVNAHIDRCLITWKKSIGRAAYNSFSLDSYAARKVFGTNIPS
jgi:hypothetical protein